MQKKSIICIVIFTIIIFSLLFIFLNYNNSYCKTKYIPTTKRTSYVLANVDDTFLNSYLQRKNTLIIFFATWCDHCINEKDTITKLYNNNPDIPVIVVSHDKSLEDLDNYLKENNLNWFVIFDPNKNIREKIDKNSSGIPYLYLIDKNSDVIDKLNFPFNYDDILNFYYK